ncbi:DUF4286 family protein [Rubrivirga sp. IMCC43871]|uniref:DUF4286 family protein n=1 Tax=Rubrivirga sp. IMCC43871 TaxID=3391575 RepID=UPI0039901797
MVIYEVNLAVDADVAEAYAEWLAPHIDEIVALPGFVSADWWAVEEASPKRVGWCVQYHVADRAALADYFTHHADRLRGDGLARFAGRFHASRRVLLPR